VSDARRTFATMQLTRRRVIAAAMDLIERDGADAVSMRRLATELGCGLVALYNHVPSMSALLDGVADAVMSSIQVTSVPAGAWQEQIRAQALAFRQIARAHPRCTMVVVSRPPSAASVVRPAEAALATLREAGFGGQDAVRIVRAFVAYIMGSLLLQIGVASALDASDGEGAETHRPRLRPAEFPQLASLTAEVSTRDPDADFEFGLDLLVHAVAAMHPCGRPGVAA
jgi:AcrR family transcriptional regulator